MRNNDDSGDWKTAALLLGCIGLAALFGWHLGAREQLPNIQTGMSKFTVALSLAGGATGLITLWFVLRRTQATERNTEAALKAVENGHKTLMHSQVSELTGRFQKGLELLDNEGDAAKIGGVLLLKTVGVEATAEYGPSVLGALRSFLKRRTSGSHSRAEAYYRFPDLTQVRPEERDYREFQWEEAELAIDYSPPDVMAALAAISDVAVAARAKNIPVVAKLQDVTIHSEEPVKIDLSLITIERCNFIGCKFVDSDFFNTAFNLCNFDDVSFMECRMETAIILSNDDIRQGRVSARFSTSDLTDAFFTLPSLDLYMCDLTSARMEGARQSFVRGCWYHEHKPTVFEGMIGHPDDLIDARGRKKVWESGRGFQAFNDAGGRIAMSH